MKKHSILVLVLLGALSLGCTKIPELVGDDETAAVIPGLTGDLGDPVTLTTTVSLGGKPESKALTAAGVKTFAVGDCVAVIYKNGSDETVKAVSSALEAGDIHDEGKTAIITVTLTNPAMNGALRYIYPAAMAKATIATDATMDDAGTVDFTRLDSQNGTLASLAAGLDLAVYDGSLTASAGLPATATLTNKLTIGEFNIKNNDGSQDITDSIVHLTVTSGTDEYRIHRLAEAGPIYVAMRPVDNANLTFGATDASNGYEKSVTGKTLAAGSMYPIDLKMSKTFDGKATPLTFEAINACTVTYTAADPSMTVQYNKNGEGWTDYSAAINLAAGEILAFRGMNDTYRSFSTYSQFTCSDDCYLYGNIMSLVTDYTSDPDAFADNVVLTGYRTFDRLFDNAVNSHIKSHTSKPIVLPATTLTESCYSSLFCQTGLTVAPVLPALSLSDVCYYGMFDGCTSLTSAPALPAATLAYSCYGYMFRDCTSLTAAPALPATTLADNCYDSMFEGCTSLTTAPALPATTMEWMCYENMFYECTSLTTAPALPATTLARGCYEKMFYGCTGLTTAPELPATTLAGECYQYMFYGCESLTDVPSVLPATKLESDCYAGMFSGCTSLTAAPVLPATILVDGCYYNMFYDCINLNSITSYAVHIPDPGYTEEWVEGVSGSGTFQINPVLDPADPQPWYLYEPYGIPAGWTVERHIVATKALADASWEDVGRLIGADGYIYSTVAAAEYAGTTAQAMIAYLGAVDGVCEHGLAISLTNVSDSAVWSDIDGVISTWASSHSIPGGSWRLPSFKDWQYLLIGTFIEAPGYYPGYYDNITTTNVLLSCVGGSLSDGEYWSSTSVDEDYARTIDICNYISAGYGECNLNDDAYKEDYECFVRACLSF